MVDYRGQWPQHSIPARSGKTAWFQYFLRPAVCTLHLNPATAPGTPRPGRLPPPAGAGQNQGQVAPSYPAPRQSWRSTCPQARRAGRWRGTVLPKSARYARPASLLTSPRRWSGQAISPPYCRPRPRWQEPGYSSAKTDDDSCPSYSLSESPFPPSYRRTMTTCSPSLNPSQSWRNHKPSPLIATAAPARPATSVAPSIPTL